MEPVITKEQFMVCVKAMKAVYTSDNFLPDEYAGKIWYKMLCDIPYNVLSTAIQIHIMSSSFPPTIKDLRAAASKAAGKNEEMNEMEAWNIVRRAIGRGYYFAEEEFEKLSPELQKAVGSPSNIRNWAQMDLSAVDSVIHSNFLRNYRTVIERKKDDMLLSPSVLVALEMAKENRLEDKMENAEIGMAQNVPQTL